MEPDVTEMFYDGEAEARRARIRVVLIWAALIGMCAGPVVVTLWRKL